MRTVQVTKAFTFHHVPARAVMLTGVTSFIGLLFASLLGWPLWRIALVMLLPWVPFLTQQTVWTYRHYHWLALFYVLVVTQTGHFFEHVAQMVQIHVLRLTGDSARGVFGALDIEWVHFIFNTWVIVLIPILLWQFRRNSWLWAAAILSGWHEIEHMVIMNTYLTTGLVGAPGLLARGGLIGGGLPLGRADLHFLYNLMETVPLLIAFVDQLQGSTAFGERGEPIQLASPGIAKV